VSADVPFSICDLDNPKRWHKRTLRRPWKHRDRLHDAVDDLALEKAMRRRRRNPLKTRRNCDMTFLSQDQEDRLVSRIAQKMRNPGGKVAARRWWKGLSSQKRMKVARSVLGRMNPSTTYRNCIIERATDGVTIIWPDDSTSWAASTQRAERTIDRFYNKHRGMRRALNPKRDGSATRGELRRVKKIEYLKTLMGKSENARLEIERLTGHVLKAGHEVGKRVIARGVKEHVESWKARHTAELAGEAPAAAPVPAEVHPEVKLVESRIRDLDTLIAGLRDEIKDLPTHFPEDDLRDDEESRLQSEIAKLAQQKQKLRHSVEGLAVATNPRGRVRYRRVSRRASHAIRSACQRVSLALRTLRRAFRS
jgi:hypothetical protein